MERKTDKADTNVQCGNRTNLLFIDTCLDHIAENKNKIKRPANDPVVKEILMYENAILGLMSGDYAAVEQVIQLNSSV